MAFAPSIIVRIGAVAPSVTHHFCFSKTNNNDPLSRVIVVHQSKREGGIASTVARLSKDGLS
jgi:hypothetical protein